MKKLSLLLLVSVFVFSAVEIYADTLYLESGEVAEGKIVQETADAYILQQGNIWKRINKTEVAYSNASSNNGQSQKIDLDLIIKFGRELSAKYNVRNSHSLDGSYDITERYYFGLEFDIRAFSDVYLGAGFNVSNYGYIVANDFYYMDIPYYLLAKLKHSVGSDRNLYASVNIGMHALITRGSMSDGVYRDDAAMKSSVYYGLNVGLELKNLLIELGFTSYGAEIEGLSGNHNYELINQSVVLSIGYKIL